MVNKRPTINRSSLNVLKVSGRFLQTDVTQPTITQQTRCWTAAPHHPASATGLLFRDDAGVVLKKYNLTGFYFIIADNLQNNICVDDEWTSNKGYLATPNYPMYYPENVDCR